MVTVDNTREQDIRGIGEGEEYGLHDSQPGQTWDGAARPPPPPMGVGTCAKTQAESLFPFPARLGRPQKESIND